MSNNLDAKNNFHFVTSKQRNINAWNMVAKSSKQDVTEKPDVNRFKYKLCYKLCYLFHCALYLTVYDSPLRILAQDFILESLYIFIFASYGYYNMISKSLDKMDYRSTTIISSHIILIRFSQATCKGSF